MNSTGCFKQFMLLTNRNQFSLQLLLQTGFIAIPFLLAAAMLFNDSEQVMSWKIFGISSSIAVFMSFFLRHVKSRTATAMASIFSVYLLVFAFPRLIQIAAAPYSTTLVADFHIDEVMLEKALVYLAFGTVAISLGIFCGSRARLDPPASRANLNTLPLIIIFLAASSISIYLQVYRGATVLLSKNSVIASEPLIATASQLFNYHFAMLLLLSATLLRRRSIGIMFLFSLIYACITVILGSRGASMNLLLMSASIVAWRASIRPCNIKINSLLAFLFMLGLITILAFPLATAVRENYLNLRVSQEGENFNPRADTLAIFNRIGANQDSQIMILGIPGNHELSKKYLNLTYALKSTVNILVPGTVFHDAKVSTSFLPRFIYEGADPKLLTADYYESRPYTAWGFAYSNLGWFGGLIFLFAASAFFSFFYKLLLMKFNKFALPALYLFGVVFPFFGMAGLDAFIVDIAKGIIQIAVLIVFIFLLTSSKYTVFKKAAL